MIHQLLFTDTFVVDSIMPFYLLIDTIFGFEFYKPYLKDVHYTSDILLMIYGYAFSIYFLYSVLSMFEWKLNKKAFFSNSAVVLFFMGIVEIFLIWFCGATTLANTVSNFLALNNILMTVLIYFLSLLLLSPVVAFFGVMGFLVLKRLIKIGE